MVVEVNFIAPSYKGKNPAHASSSTQNTPTSHHIPTSLEVIEISDSDGPNSPKFTGVNQAPVKFSVSLLETGQEIIEIVSSDDEDTSQPLHSPIQASPLVDVSQPAPIGGSPDLPDLTPIPPQSSFPALPQIPQVSSPHEVENMMDIDDTSQYSPSIPPSPPPIPSSPLPLPVPQANLSMDAIGRALSRVGVSPSPTHSTHSPYASEFVEDSEPDSGPSKRGVHDRYTPQATPTPPVENSVVQSAESDDDFHPPPPPSSSSPSHNVPVSRHSTPTVRHLLYGGPNGIFKDANASIVQHIWATVPQDPISNSPTPPLNAHPDEGLERGLSSALGAVTPPISTSPQGPGFVQVNDSASLPSIAT